MLSLLCALSLVTQALAIVGAQVSTGGITKLFGNSFGLPGTNATYDYIVNPSPPLLRASGGQYC